MLTKEVIDECGLEGLDVHMANKRKVIAQGVNNIKPRHTAAQYVQGIAST